MQIPLQITFRGIRHSDAIETAIRERAAKLERFCGDRMIACRVVVKEPNHRRQQGDLFVVTWDLTLPGAELAVGHPAGHGDEKAHENVFVAIRDTYQAMERQLKDFMSKRRKELKVHELNKPHARVTRLFPHDEYGFITTADGREIYFHTNSVIKDGLHDLDVGTEVRFTEELGDKGPQATTIECVRRTQQAAS